MLRADMGKARIGGRDVNVPCNPPEVPACAGEWRVFGRDHIWIWFFLV